MKSGYIIITPAFNEAAYIDKTVESILGQTVCPLMWVIVDDGSTDGTADIIKRYAVEHPWIKYVYRSKNIGQSYYSSNVYAIREGLKHVNTIAYDYLAILDADISLPIDYYEQILKRMEADNRLGIASGVYLDNVNGTLRKVLNDRRSTPKALMVFRKACYDGIGGFVPMKYGGEDACACFAARMQGWKTWSFPGVKAIHNKPVGTGHAKRLLSIRFKQGYGEYFLATHPLFFLGKSFRRCIKESPYIAGGLARIMGFICASFRRERRQITDELVKYIRKEQLGRVFKGNSIPTEFQVSTSCRS